MMAQWLALSQPRVYACMQVTHACIDKRGHACMHAFERHGLPRGARAPIEHLLRHDAGEDGEPGVVEQQLPGGLQQRLHLRAAAAAARLARRPLVAAQQVLEGCLGVAGRRAFDEARHQQPVQVVGGEQRRCGVLPRRRKLLRGAAMVMPPQRELVVQGTQQPCMYAQELLSKRHTQRTHAVR